MPKHRTAIDSPQSPYFHNEFDTPWKDALRRLFPDFMMFYFAEAAAQINWQAGYTVLDKELRKISRDAEMGNRFADALVRVQLLSGEAMFVLIHVEIRQSRSGFCRANVRLQLPHFRPLSPTGSQHGASDGRVFDMETKYI